MNRTAIRNFATWARTTLIEQVRSRLQTFGISEKGIIPAQNVAGGITVNGQTLNGEDADHYRQLRSLIDTSGLVGAALIAKITEEIAYIWFNRLAALRFMEVNGYLSYRCLSSGDRNLVDPEILREVGAIAAAGDFEELDFAKLTEWRELAASQPNPDEWLYRKLLLVQCRDLSKSIACLFDRDKDYTLLFLPPNLLNSDSILKKLVSAIAEEDWLDIEIVGWLYQFYISEKKDEVIGAKSKVKAEDIPAATQLFTPHWIVRYMVENSLGRLWLEAHPESSLREKMPYYLESGGELGITNGELRITNYELGIRDGGGLTPQDLTVCDPACGSGHILVYAFDLLFEIYREQGYSDREIPALILEHNLFGLDIDDRAVQLASFAVLMKARARDKRFLRRVAELPRLNILWVRNTRQFFNERELAGAGQGAIADYQMSLGLGLAEQLPLGYVAPMVKGSLVSFLTENASLSGELLGLLRVFLDADHLGSLIVPSVFDADRVYAELDRLELSFPIYGDDFGVLRDVVRQAVFLRRQFRVVVANPPYMGSKSFNEKVNTFIADNYKKGKSDLFAAFIERLLQMSGKDGLAAMVVMQSWMFLSSYEELRNYILKDYEITSLLHMDNNVMKIAFGTSAFVARRKQSNDFRGAYTWFETGDLDDAGEEPRVFPAPNERNLKAPNGTNIFYASAQDFGKIPSSAIAYWVSDRVLKIFENSIPLSSLGKTGKGSDTGNNDRFLRLWYEVNIQCINFNNSPSQSDLVKLKFRPLLKGGDYRKWYGNLDYVINWGNNANEIRKTGRCTIRNSQYMFKSCVSWTKVTSSYFSCRYSQEGFICDDASPAAFMEENNLFVLSYLNSNFAANILALLSPTLNYQVGDISNLPIFNHSKDCFRDDLEDKITKLVSISRQDWDNFETSWDFKTHPLTRYKTNLIQQAFENWQKETESAFQQLKQLEEENNRYWIAAYGLQDELTPQVPDAQITIRRADLTRDIKSLLSYAVGCIMGRYALDNYELGITNYELGDEQLRITNYEFGNEELRITNYELGSTGLSKDDPFSSTKESASLIRNSQIRNSPIIPITDKAYFTDDIVDQIIEFLKTAYSPQHLQANLDYIANALTLRTGENSRDRIRRYFLDEFVKDHIQTYKKRPIYWYFTSGKKKAFGALVYLHNYDTNTLARLRTDYVLELQRKIDNELQREQQNLALLTTTATKKASQKLIKDLQDQQLELREYQAKLQHAADKRIAIDLDDGVAYNYTLFEGLVYEGAELKMADLKKKSEWKRKGC